MDSTHPAPGPESPLINTRKLQTFVLLGIDDYLEMLGDLMREVPAQLTRLRSAIEQGNSDDCKQCAHMMRGILGYFGCVAMTDKLASLENQPNLPPTEATATYQDFQALWQHSLTAIREWEKSIPDFAAIHPDQP